MNGIEHLPPWAAALTAFLLLVGAAVTLVGSLGLLRFGTFYERVHAPTLGTTLGTVFIAAASIVCFSVLQSRPVLHEILIIGLWTPHFAIITSSCDFLHDTLDILTSFHFLDRNSMPAVPAIGRATRSNEMF